MCRYGFKTYKPHFACFSCHKAFKQPPIEGYLQVMGLGEKYQKLWFHWSWKKRLNQLEVKLGTTLDQLRETYRTAIHKCPECGRQMADLGLDFKPPRKTNEKAWRLIEKLYVLGHAWHTCGCYGPGFVPKTPQDYLEYLLKRKKEYVEQLGRWEKDGDRLGCRKAEAIRSWHNNIAALDREIECLRRKKG